MENDTSERVRLTISVTPEVHAAFTRLAAASGLSLSRAMGEWLGDTLEAVEFTASKVEEARAAPRLVMRQMHAYALGLSDETGAVLDQLRKEASAGARKRSVAPEAPSPPPSNTGGKVPRENPKRRGR